MVSKFLGNQRLRQQVWVCSLLPDPLLSARSNHRQLLKNKNTLLIRKTSLAKPNTIETCQAKWTDTTTLKRIQRVVKHGGTKPSNPGGPYRTKLTNGVTMVDQVYHHTNGAALDGISGIDDNILAS
jgi:hypothetical protein